jgi:hypothetical protein
VAQFEGDWLTTESGSLLLRQADRKIGLLRRVAGCFTDYRQPETAGKKSSSAEKTDQHKA